MLLCLHFFPFLSPNSVALWLISKPARCLGLCLAYNVIPRGYSETGCVKVIILIFATTVSQNVAHLSGSNWQSKIYSNIYNARSMSENIYQRLPCAQIAIKTKKKCHCFSSASCGHEKLSGIS